jgi:hypothetical protein
MSFLVAAIEHHARQFGRAVVRAIGEKCSGFSDYEAGDYYLDSKAFAEMLAEREAEEEVAEPRTPDAPTSLRDFIVGDQYCALCYTNITGIKFHHCPLQSPAASAGGGESSSSEVCVPPAPSEERDCCPTCGCALESGWCKNCRLAWIRDYQNVPEAVSADPSPAPASGLTWVNWAAPAIVGVLREHRYLLTVGQCSCPCDSRETPPRFNHYTWSEHVAPLIAERLFESIADIQRGTGPYAASEFFPQHRTTQ